MKHLIEFALCGAIGTYCVMRCAALMPRVIAEAHAVVAAYLERAKQLEEITEPVE